MNWVVLRQYRLCYLATPYTLYPDGLQKAFEDASRLAGRLYRNGVRVFCPIAHSHPLAVHGELNPLDHRGWMNLNRSFMAATDALVVAELQGWQKSRGVLEEIDDFWMAKKPIYYINPNSLMVRSEKQKAS